MTVPFRFENIRREDVLRAGCRYIDEVVVDDVGPSVLVPKDPGILQPTVYQLNSTLRSIITLKANNIRPTLPGIKDWKWALRIPHGVYAKLHDSIDRYLCQAGLARLLLASCAFF